MSEIDIRKDPKIRRIVAFQKLKDERISKLSREEVSEEKFREIEKQLNKEMDEYEKEYAQKNGGIKDCWADEGKGFKEEYIPPVEPSEELFYKVKKLFIKYLDTTELNYNLLATWTLGTYFHEQFETYPLLTLMARKQSGKTRTLKLISALAKGSDGSVSTSVTETLLFRHKEGSLFFDEMESLSSKEKTALRETINAIYKKGNKIIRYTEKRTPEGKEYVENSFYPFYPLGIANIYGFGDVLADRSIQIILQRSKKRQTQLIEDYSTNPEIQEIKRELSVLKARIPKNVFSEWNNFIQKKEFNEDLRTGFEVIKETKLTGRPLELFFPLFLVAGSFDVFETLINTAIEYTEVLENTSEINLDDALNDFLEKKGYEGFIPNSIILKDFKESLENSEEYTYVNSKWLGKTLKRLGVISKKRVVNGKTQVIIRKNPVELVESVEFKGVVDKNSNTTSNSLNNNSTNTTNTTNSTNSTNSTFTHEELQSTGLEDEYKCLMGSEDAERV